MDSAPTNRKSWLTAVLFALPITVVILALFTYWFASANRYIVFLYNHDMGPAVPDTSPFSRVTSSRYWMTGLVAGGFVMLRYSVLNWIIGRLRAAYQPPACWRGEWRGCWCVCEPCWQYKARGRTAWSNKRIRPRALHYMIVHSARTAVAITICPKRSAG